MGIKDVSRLIRLHKFDMARSFVFDYMHTVLLGYYFTYLLFLQIHSFQIKDIKFYLGVVKTLTLAMFDFANHSSDYYIRPNSVNKINTLWQKVQVPGCFNRPPRSISERAFWKANEWKVCMSHNTMPKVNLIEKSIFQLWFFSWLPILEEHIPARVLKHLGHLTEGVLILLEDSITDVALNRAENVLKTFCRNQQLLFGEEFCTFNVHLMLHAAQCVRWWGPLW